MEIKDAIPFLAMASSIVSSVVAWGLRQWSLRQEAELKKVTEHLAAMQAQGREDRADIRQLRDITHVQHEQLVTRISALEESVKWRVQSADEQHVLIFKRLDKIEDRQLDIQRQVDRRATSRAVIPDEGGT